MNDALPYRLVFDAVGQDLDAARACEAEVFLDRFANSPEEMAEEYGAYESATGFIAIIDDSTGEAVAAMRFIAPGPAGLKTLNDVSRPPWRVDGLKAAAEAGIDPERTWDVATIAVRPGRGLGGMCAAALYSAISLSSIANGCNHIVMLMDKPALDLLIGLSMHVEPLPGTFAGEYLGSTATTPVLGDLHPGFERMERENPDAHRLIRQGLGFDDLITMPTDWTWHRKAIGQASD